MSFSRSYIVTLLCVLTGGGETQFSNDQTIIVPPVTNSAPVVGILSQTDGLYPNHTMIAASYVKWVESAGGQVVPVPCDTPKTQLENLYKQLSGVVFPGGDAPMTPGHCYYDAAAFFVQKALQHPEDYFVVHAACLGWEILANIIAGKEIAHQQVVDIEDEKSVTLTEEANNSRLLSSFSANVLYNLQHSNSTYENHHHGVFVDVFQNDPELSSFFSLLATARTQTEAAGGGGAPYVGIVEGKEYPFYATQFHPEKNQFEWHLPFNGIHSLESIQVGQAFGNFFVNEARRSPHKFGNCEELQQQLIYNYNPIYTPSGYFVQVYLFPKKTPQNQQELMISSS